MILQKPGKNRPVAFIKGTQNTKKYVLIPPAIVCYSGFKFWRSDRHAKVVCRADYF